MFTSIAPPFQLMRKSKRKREEVVSTSTGAFNIKKQNVDQYSDPNCDIPAQM
jgi:hypothetical protein